MLYRFPPSPEQARDPSFLTGKTETFAKLKLESQAGKRQVFMTEHTLIFVLKGSKILHFGDESVTVAPDSVILLKKGIYVMAEYVEDKGGFEALMLFLPATLLRHFGATGDYRRKARRLDDHCMVFKTTSLIHTFKEGLRKYFEHTPSNYEELIPLKQKEILLLLLSGDTRQQVSDFISHALSTDQNDLEFTITNYLFQPISVAELAGLCNRSLASFKRDFQQRFDCSPRTWINKQRLLHASMLLRNTKKQIADIALDCGFENTSYFIRIFKKEYGCTPNELRQRETLDA